MPPSWLKFIILTLSGAFSSAAIETEPIEGPPLVFASEVVPLELQSGDRFQLSPIGQVINFEYEFRLESDFGDYDVRGIDMLRLRIHEIEALEKLEEIGKTKAFATSFSEALKNPLVRTWAVARKPITTVSRIPGGIIRYLQGKFYEVKRGSEKVATHQKERSLRKANREDPPKEESASKVTVTANKVGSATKKLSRRHLGFDKAKRHWARRLNVDPYSTNEYLQFELERIAWASSVGSFAGEFAIPTSSVLSYTLQAQEMVWSKSATELERINFIALKKMGVDNSALMVFSDIEHYTLTEKIQMVLMLDMLEIEGRLDLIQLLLEVETREEALLLVKITTLFSDYNRLVGPLDRLAIQRGLAVAYSSDGTMILPLALDYLHWSPEITQIILSDELQAESRTIWIGGTASSISKRRLADQNWRLEENCFDTFDRLSTLVSSKN